MNKTVLTLLSRPAAVLLLLFISASVPPAAAAETFSVAVLPFLTVNGKATPLERTATDVLRERLLDEPALRLVPMDRTSAVAAELDLTAGAHIGDEDARLLGILAGADVVIIGKTAASGRHLTFSGRLVGVKSLAADDVRLEGDRVGRIGPLVSSFSALIAERLIAKKDYLAFSSPEDLIVAEQRDALAGKALPSVYLSVMEEYEGNRRAESAVERLLADMLQAVGFEPAASVKNADAILFAVSRGRPEGRVRGAMISTTDVEIRVVNHVKGELLYHEAITHRAIDPLSSTAGSVPFRESVLLLARDLLPAMLSPRLDMAEKP